MAVMARLVKGAKYKDLTTAPYAIMNWLPPGAQQDFSVSTGTSANRTGGGALVGSKLSNQTFGLSVRILGSGEQELRGYARQLVQFSTQFDDPTEPLYLDFKPNALPAPFWGQMGAMLRYEIIGAKWTMGERYQYEAGRAAGYTIDGELTVKPVAIGQRQRVLTAAGGVFEDYLGSTDGRSLGLLLDEGGTNKMTNPVFGNATWSTGWTAGAGALAAQNTNPAYILFGTTSARVYQAATGAAGRFYVQSIAAGNTNTHTLSFYAKRPDGGAVTVADCQAGYSVAKSSTYVPVGDGWYRVWATFAGIAAATNTGVFVYSDIYVDGFQLEELGRATPLMYGDALGHAWTGTVHASTSTRAAASVKLPAADMIQFSSGSISVTFKSHEPNTAATNMSIFDTRDAGHAVSLYAYYLAADDKFYLTDGVNTISTAAQTFAAETIINLVFTWGPGGLAIYKDGSSTPAASGASYTIPSNGTHVFVGSSFLSLIQVYGTIMGVTSYDRQLTAADAAAVGTAARAAAVSGTRCDYLPWLWTVDGDNIVDSDQEYAVASGIPGTLDAVTQFIFETPPVAAQSTTLWLSRCALPLPKWLKVGGQFVDVTAVATAISTIPNLWTKTVNAELFAGREVYALARCIDAGANLTARANVTLTGQTISSPYLSIDPDTATERLFGVGSVYIPPIARFVGETTFCQLSIEMVRTTGGASNVTPDNLNYFPRPILKVDNIGATGAAFDNLGIQGNEAHSLGDTLTFRQFLSVVGDIVELQPEQWNVMLSLVGAYDETSPKTRTATYIAVYVTPRWGLI